MAKKYTPPPAQRRPQPKPAAKPKPAAHTGEAQPTGWLTWALVVLAITAACYLPSLKNELVNWDDDPNIRENPNLELPLSWEGVRNIFDIEKGAVIGNYNPLPILTFAIEKTLSGNELNYPLIHGTNLFFHLLTVFFVFLLLSRMGMGNLGATVGALLFGIHPMRVESVAWATERKDVLFAAFFFWALLYYIKWIKTEDSGQRMRQYIIMLVLAILSCFSKVQAVTLPLSMLALDYWYRRPISFKLIWEKTPFWLLSLAFGLINIYTLGREGSIEDDVTNFTFVDRLCIGAYSFVVYLYKLVIPHPMSPLYPYPKPLPITVYLAPIAFFAFWGGMYLLWKRDRRMWIFGSLFFFFNVMFLLQVLGAGQGFLADRFTYVPYFGFFAIAGWYFDRFSKNESVRPILMGVTGIAFAVFGFVTVRQIGIWENGGTLWSHVMKYEEKTSSLPYWNRGQYLRSLGNYDAALKDYTQAIAINPKNAELYNSRGKTYFDMAMSGKFPNAGELHAKALVDYDAGLGISAIKPKTRAEMLINRGAALGAARRYDEALRDLNEGLKLEPNNKNGYFNRSILYFQRQEYDKAIGDYTEYLKYDPNNANIWYERGMLQRVKGNNAEAIDNLSRAIKLNPKFGLAYIERARAHMQSGNPAAAQPDYQRAEQYGVRKEPLDQTLMNK